jgi:hypothetical protein
VTKCPHHSPKKELPHELPHAVFSHTTSWSPTPNSYLGSHVTHQEPSESPSGLQGMAIFFA